MVIWYSTPFSCMHPHRHFTFHSAADLFNLEPSQVPVKYTATIHIINCEGSTLHNCHHCLFPITHLHLSRVEMVALSRVQSFPHTIALIWEIQIQRFAYWCSASFIAQLCQPSSHPSSYHSYPPWLNIEHFAESVSLHLSGSTGDNVIDILWYSCGNTNFVSDQTSPTWLTGRCLGEKNPWQKLPLLLWAEVLSFGHWQWGAFFSVWFTKYASSPYPLYVKVSDLVSKIYIYFCTTVGIYKYRTAVYSCMFHGYCVWCWSG